MNSALKWLLLMALTVGLVFAVGCSWAPDDDEEEDTGNPIDYEEPPSQEDPGQLTPAEQQDVGEGVARNYTDNVGNISTFANAVGTGNFDFGSGLLGMGDLSDRTDGKLPRDISLAQPDSFESVTTVPQGLLNQIAGYEATLTDLGFVDFYVPNLQSGDWYVSTTQEANTGWMINIYVRFLDDIWESESTPIDVLTHAELVVRINTAIGPVLWMYNLDRDNGNDMDVDGQMVRYANINIGPIAFTEIGVTDFTDVPVEEGSCEGTYTMQNYDTFIGENNQLFQVPSTTTLELNADCTGEAWVDVGLVQDFLHVVFETRTSGYYTIATDGHNLQYPFGGE